MCLVLHFMFNCFSGKVLIFLAMLPRKGRSLSYVISQSCTSLLLYSPCSTEGCVVICIVCYLFVSLLISRTRHGYLRINSHQLLWISCLNGTLLSSKIIVLCVMLCSIISLLLLNSSLKTARGIHMSREILN